MGTVQQDVQFALRMMRKNLGFTTAAVLCLMLGIGATTGICTVVNAVLLQPLPYSHPEQLVRVYTEFPTFPNGGLHRFWISGPEFIDLKRDTKSWASLDAWVTGGANLAGKTQPVRVAAAYLSGGLLETKRRELDEFVAWLLRLRGRVGPKQCRSANHQADSASVGVGAVE